MHTGGISDGPLRQASEMDSVLLAGFFSWLLAEFFKSFIWSLILLAIVFFGFGCLAAYVIYPFLKKEGSASEIRPITEAHDYLQALEERAPHLGVIARANCTFRKDLPPSHRGEVMQLERTPVGRDFHETEEILQSIFGQGFPGWSSELKWALYPPIGPQPKASWKEPPYDLNDGVPTSVYIIRFRVYLTDGSEHIVFKPGLTRSGVVTGGGKRGRYSKKFSPEVIYEQTGLAPGTAWAAEQKLLNYLPTLPWEHSFYDWIWYWNTHEDLMVETNGDYIKTRELIDHRRKASRQKPKVDYERIAKSKSDSLGETEWRAWNGSIPELIDAAQKVVDFCREHELHNGDDQMEADSLELL